MAVPAQEIGISGAQSACELLVFYRTAVDKEELRHRGPARIGRQGRIATQADSLAFGVDLQRILYKFPPHNPPQPRLKLAFLCVNICAKNDTPFTAAGHIA